MASTAMYVSDREALAVVMGGSARSPKVTRVERLEFAPPGFDEEGDPLPEETISDMRAVELRNWVKSQRLGGKGIAVLDASHVIFRDLRIEFSERRQIDKIIKFQVEGVIPSLSIDDLCVGYTLDDVSEAGSKITVAAARRDAVRTLVEDLEFAGLKPMHCDSTVDGILNLRSFNEKLSNVASPTVWVDLQDDIALLAVLDGITVLSKRAIQIPSKAVVELGEARGLRAPPPIPGVEDAPDETLPTSGGAADQPANAVSLSTLASLLKIEVRRIAVSVRASGPISKLVISGAPAAAQGGLEDLGRELGFGVEFVDLLESMLPVRRDGSAKIELPDSAMIPATAGLALLGLGFEGTGIDYLSGDLAPASTFDYVKWPISVALMLAVLVLAFMLALTIVEKQKLDKDLFNISTAKNINLKDKWNALQATEHFDKDFPTGETNSALISGVYRVLGEELVKFRAGDKSNYPPVYESEKILAEVMNVFAKNIARNHGDPKFVIGDGSNENFALSKFVISQQIGSDITKGKVSIDCYLDNNPYPTPIGPGAASDGKVSDEELMRNGLESLKVDNPAWDGTDPNLRLISLVQGNVGIKYGSKFIPRGERRIGPDETKPVAIVKHTISFDLTPLVKKK